jgi:hypothetical protein
MAIALVQEGRGVVQKIPRTDTVVLDATANDTMILVKKTMRIDREKEEKTKIPERDAVLLLAHIATGVGNKVGTVMKIMLVIPHASQRNEEKRIERKEIGDEVTTNHALNLRNVETHETMKMVEANQLTDTDHLRPVTIKK